MKELLKQVFIWWSGNTIGTRFFTWRKGIYVGRDQFGNIYYEGSYDKDGNPRRWVIYRNYSEASSIPSGWHGWIHHRTDVPPSKENYQPIVWEKDFLPNQTGSSQGKVSRFSKEGEKRSQIRRMRKYKAWSPEK